MKRMIWMLLFACIVLAACAGQDGIEIDNHTPVVSADDANLVSYEALWSQADAVFMGQVTYISPTIAETGSKEMFHQIAFSVVETSVDQVGIGTGVVMTVPGQSPVDDILVVRDDAQLVGTAVHNLQVGDQTVVFARMGNLADSQDGPAVLMPLSELDQPFLGIEHWANVSAFSLIAANTNGSN